MAAEKERPSGRGRTIPARRIAPLAIFLLLAFPVFPQQAKIFRDQPAVMDYDGNVYRTIKIGDQTWMAENLRVTHFRDGTPIPEIRGDQAWSALATGALCWMENDPAAHKKACGALYNFHAVHDPRRLSPAGWHIPTREEWLILESYLGGSGAAGGEMKDIASGLWRTVHPGAGNISGFSAVPAGGRGRAGSFGEAGYYATWWTSTSHDADYAWHWGLYPDKPGTRSNPGHKASGFSVRCIKDR